MKSFGLVFLLSFGVVTDVAGGASPTKAAASYEVIKSTFTYAPDLRPNRTT